jgi:hypothetical protein
MTTTLVVANKTLPGEELADAIRERIAEGERTFHVVVPLTPVSHGVLVDESESAEAARGRLAAFIEALKDQGAEADGEVGDSDPIQAVRDCVRTLDVEEVILSTLPSGASRWLRADVPSRLARAVDVPITTITQRATADAPS